MDTSTLPLFLCVAMVLLSTITRVRRFVPSGAWLVLTFTVMLCLCCGISEMVGHIWGSFDDLLATVLLMAFAGRKCFRLAVGMVCWALVRCLRALY